MNQQFKPTVIFEDNATCVNQMNIGFIKADMVKHISLHIFSFAQDLIETGQIDIKKIESEYNIVDMLTKALPAYKHKKLVVEAGMRNLHKLSSSQTTLFSSLMVFQLGFYTMEFLMRHSP